MVRKQKLLVPFGLALLLVGWLGLSILSHREPSYHGRRLSDWARQYGANNWGTNRVAAKEAEIAIQHIGTNGIPYLLQYMQRRDSALKAKLRKVIPRKWHNRLHLQDRAGDIRRVGAHGIAALGTNAAGALPSLIQIATNHPDEDGRYIAVFAIRTLGPASEPALPFLIQCLTNSSAEIRDDAALGLGYNRLRPAVAVPALIQYVNFAKTSPRSFEFRDAVESLARLSPGAALDIVLPMVDDPNPAHRDIATNLLSELDAGVADGHTILGIADGRFTINGLPTFLLGFSYFAGLGASDASVRKDLDAFQRRHFNWLRVFGTWNAAGTNFSIVNTSGAPRQPFMDNLERLVQMCDYRGFTVDVTLARGKDALPDFNSHQAAVSNLVTELRYHRNWYLDLANEHDVHDDRFVPDQELKLLRAEVRRLDPNRLVTASFGGHDLGLDEIRAAVDEIGLDFICPHRPRNPESPAQTFLKTTNYLAILKQTGRIVPIHYQEPFRRDYSTWQPRAGDFLTDLRGAISGGAAGWCFHNGAGRDNSGNAPRRCFDLRAKRLFDQLDPEERKFVDEAADVFVEIPKPTRSAR